MRPDRHSQRGLVGNRYVEDKALIAQSRERAGPIVGAEPIEQGGHAQRALQSRPLRPVSRSITLALLPNQPVEGVVPGRQLDRVTTTPAREPVFKRRVKHVRFTDRKSVV